jgi:hypothetical protein
VNFSRKGADDIVLLLDNVAVGFETLTHAGQTALVHRDDDVLRGVPVIQSVLKGLIYFRAGGAGGLGGDKNETGRAG